MLIASRCLPGTSTPPDRPNLSAEAGVGTESSHVLGFSGERRQFRREPPELVQRLRPDLGTAPGQHHGGLVEVDPSPPEPPGAAAPAAAARPSSSPVRAGGAVLLHRLRAAVRKPTPVLLRVPLRRRPEGGAARGQARVRVPPRPGPPLHRALLPEDALRRRGGGVPRRQLRVVGSRHRQGRGTWHGCVAAARQLPVLRRRRFRLRRKHRGHSAGKSSFYSCSAP
jgi:hypothetical protein